MFPSTSLVRDIDSDEDDEEESRLYGKHTWKIDKFSEINKREVRSSVFEVGGHKWYVVIYPEGRDVCNHLSLFLCVANHEKLLPGWSHFAQFTIAVVNKDPKKSKYSDALHRFWMKEHDWGWKKFMGLSKVEDGFIDADTMIIKTQVQVIRVRGDRLFRCLDCVYRRKLARVYLKNVEQICGRFVEEHTAKLGKLIDDKPRWSSLCAFWLGMDERSKERMCQETRGSILKGVVKRFFMEKEVISTLVVDSLYRGLKALKGQEIRGNCSDQIVGMKNDAFVLMDDVLRLLQQAAQNRVTSLEHDDDDDDRRLAQLGRRTIEIFVLAHIFGKIEFAYQEALSLKKQEQLIREEEVAARRAEIKQKPRRTKSKKNH